MFNKYKEKYERLLAEHNRLWGVFQSKIRENNIAHAHLGRISEMKNAHNMKMLAKDALKQMGKYYEAK